MLQSLLVTITGTKEIYVENYKGLLDYKNDLIVIQGKKETMIVRGKDFLIDYFSGDSMKIKGSILSIEYCGTSKTSDRRWNN